MPNLKHPETGESVRASHATAERLRDEGWEDLSAPAEPVPEPDEVEPEEVEESEEVEASDEPEVDSEPEDE